MSLASINSDMTAPTPRRRLAYIQILRGIAVMMVVLAHLSVIERKYSPDTFLGDWANIGLFGVDLFFVISGFIMIYVTQDTPRKFKAALKFLRARALRIYPLYGLITAMVLVLWIWKPDMVFSTSVRAPNIIKSFLLWPDHSEPLLAIGWSLIHEMFFYIVFTLILCLARKWIAAYLIIWAGFTLIGQQFGWQALSAETKIIFSPLSLEFIFGAFAALWVLKPGAKSSARYIWASLALGIAAFFAASIYIGQVHAPTSLHDLDRAIWIGTAFAIITGACAALNQNPSLIGTIMVPIGNWSYAIYLTHILTLSLIGRLWSLFARPGYVDNILMIALMLIATLIIGWGCHKFFERPVIKFTKANFSK